MRIFLLLFLLFPLAELALLIQVGGSIGVLGTILLLVLSGLSGILLMRFAGFATAWRARERLLRGELPSREMLQDMMIVVAGGLMCLPVFLSHLVARLMLYPPSRKMFLGVLGRRPETQAQRRRAFADDLHR